MKQVVTKIINVCFVFILFFFQCQGAAKTTIENKMRKQEKTTLTIDSVFFTALKNSTIKMEITTHLDLRKIRLDSIYFRNLKGKIKQISATQYSSILIKKPYDIVMSNTLNAEYGNTLSVSPTTNNCTIRYIEKGIVLFYNIDTVIEKPDLNGY